MAGIWVHGEIAGDGSLAKLSTEVATLARAIAAETGGAEVVGIVIGSKPSWAADERRRFVEGPDRHRAHDRGSRRRHDRRSTAGGTHRGASARHRHDRRGSEGRDLAGALSATGWGVLASPQLTSAGRPSRDAFGVRRQAPHRERAVGQEGHRDRSPEQRAAEPARGDRRGPIAIDLAQQACRSSNACPPSQGGLDRRRGSSSLARRGVSGPDGSV